MVGVTLGGGIGPWGGLHGLVIDALLSLRVVTANGTLIDVSESSHPDLFWAFRGAGANFGIVLSTTYPLQQQVNNGQILVADVIFTAEQNASYFQLLESYNGTQPATISVSSFMSWNATIGAVSLSIT
jgi:FAD/FMN-containing dehydrogenase